MKAQELRDRLAAVRNFDIMVQGRAISHGDVVIDIKNNKVLILEPVSVPQTEKKEEVKK